MSRIGPQWLDRQYSDHWSPADVLLREEPGEEEDEEEDEGNTTDEAAKRITLVV
jgi:hypothetical protein